MESFYEGVLTQSKGGRLSVQGYGKYTGELVTDYETFMYCFAENPHHTAPFSGIKHVGKRVVRKSQFPTIWEFNEVTRTYALKEEKSHETH
jgi:hypothetical protein